MPTPDSQELAATYLPIPLSQSPKHTSDSLPNHRDRQAYFSSTRDSSKSHMAILRLIQARFQGPRQVTLPSPILDSPLLPLSMAPPPTFLLLPQGHSPWHLSHSHSSSAISLIAKSPTDAPISPSHSEPFISSQSSGHCKLEFQNPGLNHFLSKSVLSHLCSSYN